MINEKITILDLGSHKIKLLVISLNEKNYIDIHAKFSIYSSGIKKGNIVDIEKFSSKIKLFFRALVSFNVETFIIIHLI